MSVTYGKRVTGEKEHAAAVAASAGGAEVFGKRVRGSLGVNNPDNTAKANSEFGVRTLQHAEASDMKGKGGTVSIEELEKILDTATGNPTFFDSLYENELALKGGPRKAALEIFLRTETGIKGAGRRHVIDEIRHFLGLDTEVAKRAAEDIDARQEQLRGQEERNEENLLLRDAPRLEALRRRDETLGLLRSSKNQSTLRQAPKLTAEGQRQQIAEGKSEGKSEAKGADRSETKSASEGEKHEPSDKPASKTARKSSSRRK